MHRYTKAIRALVKGERLQEETPDFVDMLRKHDCSYLLSKLELSREYKTDLHLQHMLNEICVKQRYTSCKPLFRCLEEQNILYAVMKGAILSKTAYNDPFCRRSGDIDLLIDRKDIDVVKTLLLQLGYTQGRVTANGIQPFSRAELLFQTAMSHQIAPFVKATNSALCPYVNIDVNLDIMWGESKHPSDMEFVLQKREDITVCDVPTKKLCKEMEFIALCLHHYKDMNSIYLLYERGLSLSHFCDIYFFLKNIHLNKQILSDYCCRLNIGGFVYYCLYYTNLLFSDEKLQEYMALLYSKDADVLIDSFGLADEERQSWDIDFNTRLFDADMRNYLEKRLSQNMLNKIKVNQQFM